MLQEYIMKAIVPEAPITVSVEQYQGKEILTVKVWAASNNPYVFDGSIFYRRGSQPLRLHQRNVRTYS